MPDVVFRVVLPLYAVLAVATIMAHRFRLWKETGRDPIVVRPFHKSDTPHRYLESAFALGAPMLALDILLNAVSAGWMRAELAIPVLRASALLGWLGLGLVTSGLLLCGVAVRHMGASWRIGIDRERPGPLVTRGLFSRMRHPIYAGLLLVTSGMAALTADLLSVTVMAAAWVGIPVQARLEEEFLRALAREEYESYQARTGRFWPKAKR